MKLPVRDDGTGVGYDDNDDDGEVVVVGSRLSWDPIFILFHSV